MVNRSPTAAVVCLGLASLAVALALPRSAEAQAAQRLNRAQADPVFELAPQSACMRLSTMQIGSNSQQAMRSGAQNHNSSRSNRTSGVRIRADSADIGAGDAGSGATTRAQNHNSSRSNRTQPMARPDLVTGDLDGDGFPDMLGSARIRIVEASGRARGSGGAADATVRLEIGDPDSDDDAISDLVNATTFRVTRGAEGQRGSPLYESSPEMGQSPLYEGAAAPGDGPTRTWSYALVPVMGDPDSDQDGYGDVLAGATLRVVEAGGRFHMELELAATGARSNAAERLEAPAFSISKRSARTGR